MKSLQAWLGLSVVVVLVSAFFLPEPALAGELKQVDYVNPFIGTSGHGHTYPGATVPFGMVQLSPDTYTKNWDWCSGYHWSDGSMLGFSHTHLSGTGCGDLGDILFAATTGKVNLVPGTREAPEKGYRSRFSHSDETASPGYYSVLLKTYGIKAELTATPRVGFHRYTYPKTSDANIVIDLVSGIGDTEKPIALELNIVDDRTVTGLRRSKGWAPDQTVFFAARFSKPFKSFGTAKDENQPLPGTRECKGENVKGWVTFDATDGKPVEAKVALSTASIEGAMANMDAEAPHWNFDAVRKQARLSWQRELGKIRAEGARKVLETFYTALYHAFLAPTLISDVNGDYRGSDHNVSEAEGFKNYSTFSLWDTFRAEHPLFTILKPAMVNDMIKSFLAQAQYHKDRILPIWPLYANETYCMIGYHSFPVIAEAYAKGIRNWDAEALFNLMIENSKRNDWWAERGYIPCDKEEESVSKTLEFAYDDWALAQFAGELGREQEHDKFMKRAQEYKNLFDKETGLMRPRLQDGSWKSPFDPTAIPDRPRDFTEGNSWQYSWFVPQDVKGLIDLMGGRDAFVKKLDAFFEQKPTVQETKDMDVTGLIGQYAQGNEPSHHVAYLYCYAGAPAKTQERVRKICDELYGNTPEGLCGNEDCGQMSAWYVLSTLGFYPVNPVQGTYVLGAPGLSKAHIKLPNGKTFTVVARNFSPQCKYVKEVRLNGRALDRVYLTHKELLSGGQLEFEMSPSRDSKWGTNPDAAPPSMSDTLSH